MKRSPLKRKTPMRREGPTFTRERKPMARSGAGARRRVRVDCNKTALAHKDALAQLGCMVCRRIYPHLAPGPVQLHHRRGGGWGKGDHRTLIPLCHEHHVGDSGVHGLGTKGFEKRYGFSQSDLLADALSLLRTS
jgi:hypothetical protein